MTNVPSAKNHLTQEAPWPDELEALVLSCRFKAHEHWSVHLDPAFPRDQDPQTKQTIGRGATLIVTTRGYDTYHPDRGRTYGVNHFFIVPAATYTRDAWDRWLFDQFAKVMLHETMEEYVQEVCGHCGAFPDSTGDHSCSCPEPDHGKCGHSPTAHVRPFAPLHAPGADPYTVHHYATDELKRTRPSGEIVPE